MKLAFFDDFKLGVVTGDKVVDVSDVVKDIPRMGPQDVMRGVIEKFDQLKGKLADAAAKGQGKPVSQVKLRAPLPKPENIICMAVNYMEDGTLPGARADQRLHEVAELDHRRRRHHGAAGHGALGVRGRGEFAVVIGKKASHVKAADAMNYVFGYTNFIDGSARGVVPPTNVFYQMKSRDTFAPIGPVHRHRRRDQGPAQAADRADQQRHGDAEVQLRRHGAQDPALHRVGDRRSTRCCRATSSHRHQPSRASTRSWTGDKIEYLRGSAPAHQRSRTDKRTWARITRLQHKERAPERAHAADRRQIHASGRTGLRSHIGSTANRE
jgi:2-keto-4-pentenoate hydratase/2-oxohepta-3-ene-1,7-dioic acid hydratase in catechol pathway